jgi:hypothetical protein
MAVACPDSMSWQIRVTSPLWEATNMLAYRRQIRLCDDKGIENTSVSSVVSCNACAKVIFQVVAVADSVDNNDDEGCDFALTVAAGLSMIGVAEKGNVARL